MEVENWGEGMVLENGGVMSLGIMVLGQGKERWGLSVACGDGQCLEGKRSSESQRNSETVGFCVRCREA